MSAADDLAAAATALADAPPPEPMPHLVVPVPARENAAAKARRLLLEGRVRVRLVHRGRAWVEVRGDSGRIHNVAYRHGRWSCTCEARSLSCSHLRATWLVIAEEGENR